MGTQMTKELGLFNEEERVCTPVGPQRYRLLQSDPRSATVGIVRTPIQVKSTPTNTKPVSQPSRVSDIQLSLTENSENHKELKNDSCYKEEEDSCDVKDEAKITGLPVKCEVRYLETDIDKVDSPVSDSNLLSLNEQSKLCIQAVISPLSQNLSRPSVLVECTPELFALHSRIENISFCDFDVHTDDPSVVVSEDDQTSQRNDISINNWLMNIENNSDIVTPSKFSYTDSPKQVAKKQKELNALKKQLFFTPDIKPITKTKVRTPLGDLQSSQLQDSPQKIMRSKQWRNIEDERRRRGLLDSENTPPNLPPLSKVASAPGKMLVRKQNKTTWDEDNAMLI